MDTPTDNPPAPEVLPDPPWRTRRRSAPRKQLTQEAIVEAALRLLDRDGLDAVSMRGVSEELGTGAASLYWHVADKEELLDLLLDRILAEIELPTGKRRWQDQIKEFARRVRQVMSAHRDVARITLARIPTGPNSLVRMEWLLALMERAGIPGRAIALGSDALMLYVNAFCYEEAVPFRAIGSTAEIDDEGAQVLQDYLTSLPADQFPTFKALGPDLTAGTFEERFEFGLDMIVKGLESFARPKRR